MTTLKQNINQKKLTGDPNLEKVWKKILEVKKSLPNASLSPFDFFVRYTDSSKTKIAEVIFETPGSTTKTKTKISNKQEMLDHFSEKISEALKSGAFPIKNLSFSEIQRNKDFILKKNEAGRKIRVAGVDADFERYLTRVIQEKANKLGYDLAEGYYFGSRVMTRDVLAKIDPSVLEYMQLSEGVLKKNAVRTEGLTYISDLETFLVLTPKPGTKRTQDENYRARQLIRDELNAKTRKFPFGLFVLVAEPGKQETYLPTIEKYVGKELGWGVPKEQYVKFFHRNPTAPCDWLYRSLRRTKISN